MASKQESGQPPRKNFVDREASDIPRNEPLDALFPNRKKQELNFNTRAMGGPSSIELALRVE